MRIAAGGVFGLGLTLAAFVAAAQAQPDSTGGQPPGPPPVAVSPIPPRVAPPPPRPVTSATVPPSDRVYRELDRLDALGLIPGSVLGQRPLSRAEIARILRRASNTPRAAVQPARDMLIRLRREFPWQEGVEPRGMDEVRYGAAWLSDEPRQFLKNNGLGQVEAINQPLTADRGGRFYRTNGGTAWLRTRHVLPMRGNLVFTVAPEVSLRFGGYDGGAVPNADSTSTDEADVQGDFMFHALNARYQLGPVVLQAGRDAVAWGPSPSGSLLLSTNARPLDMACLTTESPFRLPWIFRALGPSRWFVGIAALGEERSLTGSALAMLRASFRVHRTVEIGFSETLVMLGDDAPTDDFWQYLWEFFPAGRVGTDSDLADHRFGFDGRWHVWPGRLSLFGEILVEDARVGHYEDVTARRLGFYLPAVGPDGLWDVRGEFLRLPAMLYRHGRWTTGYALNGHLLGNDIGPDARGARLRLERTGTEGQRTILEFAWETRDRDTWSQVEDPDSPGTFEDIYRVEDRPSETRWRARLEFDWPLTTTLDCQPALALERVIQVAGERGHDRTDAMAELSFRYAFVR